MDLFHLPNVQQIRIFADTDEHTTIRTGSRTLDLLSLTSFFPSVKLNQPVPVRRAELRFQTVLRYTFHARPLCIDQLFTSLCELDVHFGPSIHINLDVIPLLESVAVWHVPQLIMTTSSPRHLKLLDVVTAELRIDSGVIKADHIRFPYDKISECLQCFTSTSKIVCTNSISLSQLGQYRAPR